MITSVSVCVCALHDNVLVGWLPLQREGNVSSLKSTTLNLFLSLSAAVEDLVARQH